MRQVSAALPCRHHIPSRTGPTHPLLGLSHLPHPLHPPLPHPLLLSSATRAPPAPMVSPTHAWLSAKRILPEDGNMFEDLNDTAGFCCEHHFYPEISTPMCWKHGDSAWACDVNLSIHCFLLRDASSQAVPQYHCPEVSLLEEQLHASLKRADARFSQAGRCTPLSNKQSALHASNYELCTCMKILTIPVS